MKLPVCIKVGYVGREKMWAIVDAAGERVCLVGSIAEAESLMRTLNRAAEASAPAEASRHYSSEHRLQFWAAVQAELAHAYAKHGALPWSRHEFFAVLREEVDELWDDVKSDAPTENLLREMIQIAAMCVRYAETPDRYKGQHPLPLPTRGGKESRGGE